MLETSVPLMVIRSDIRCLIRVNDQPMGESSPQSYVAFPVSSEGDYYICAVPLENSPGSKRYSITRKLSFEQGSICAPQTGDVQVYAWPGGMVELMLCPGSIEIPDPDSFPYTISRLEFECGRRALTLYYESGLRLALEENGRIISGYCVGTGHTGNLSPLNIGQKQMVALQAGMANQQRLLITDRNLEPILDIADDDVMIIDSNPASVKALNTLAGHEKRVLYEYDGKQFQPGEPQIGFFTHEYHAPEDPLSLAICFCEAVRLEIKEEAASYLTADLASGLDFTLIRQLLGEFDECRPPLSDHSGNVLGLAYGRDGAVKDVRLFNFSFESGRISNISEM